jgi:hypothetical protein
MERKKWKGFDELRADGYNAAGRLGGVRRERRRISAAMSTIRADQEGRPEDRRIAIGLGGRHCLGIASGQALPSII